MASSKRTPREHSDPSIARIERAMRGFKRIGNAQRIQHRMRSVTGIDLDGSSFVMLMRIGETGSARLTELASQLWLDLSVVSRRVRQLEERGFVERTTDPEDARAARVTLSDSGREIAERITAARHASLRDIFAEWATSDKEQLGELLERFMTDLVASYETSTEEPHE
jgi:DNA-binding MarR family transcriptional regulator